MSRFTGHPLFHSIALGVLFAACGTVRGSTGADTGRGDDAHAVDRSDAEAAADGGADAGSASPDARVADAGPAASRVELMTTSGRVRGVERGATIAFKGLPYAAAPVGDLRWRAPEPAPSWSDTRSASAFGPMCPQLGEQGQARGSEDCLHLNVWIPREAPPRLLPVIVYIHGGSSVEGSTSSVFNGVPLYDGAELAARGPAVVVTANYRLGALGFLAHSALAAADGATGNYALLDQIAALQWVQANAAAFGGDRLKVLLVGQSAGGFDTCALLTAPRASGLFSRAAIHSGGCWIGERDADLARGQQLAADAGCGGGGVAACLRAKPLADLLALRPRGQLLSGAIYHPTADGVLVPAQPLVSLARGQHADVPLLIGNTHEEMSWFIGAFVPDEVTTEAQYAAAIEALVGAASRDRVAGNYPVANYGTYEAAVQAMYGDATFVCPARRAARAAVLTATQPIYRFVFTHHFHGGVLATLGAGHGFDLYFLFHNFNDRVAADAAELALSDEMIQRWVSFADSGDPGPGWPRFTTAGDAHLSLTTPPVAGRGERAAECDLWDEVAGL